MEVTLLKAKLHRACVTHTDSNREGAFAIDGDLLDLAGIQEYEQLHVYNATNGERLTSYAVRAEHGSRAVAVNGAAAFKAAAGDRLIICTYVGLNRQEASGFKPVLVYCDEYNRVTGAANAIPIQMVS
jgi:aspartate 1-decarboxylase